MNLIRKQPKKERELVEGIIFDEVPFINVNNNDGENSIYKVPTIYNVMNPYIKDRMDVDEIINYDAITFVNHMKSMKRLFENRVDFLFKSLTHKLMISVKEAQPNSVPYSPTEFWINNSEINNEFTSMIKDINTYVGIKASKIKNMSEFYEILSMEYASYLFNRFQIYNGELVSSEEKAQELYKQINSLICINSNEFIFIINKLCYEEPLVDKYIEILCAYSDKNGFIPDELLIQ